MNVFFINVFECFGGFLVAVLQTPGHCIELDYMIKVFILSFILQPKHKELIQKEESKDRWME